MDTRHVKIKEYRDALHDYSGLNHYYISKINETYQNVINTITQCVATLKSESESESESESPFSFDEYAGIATLAQNLGFTEAIQLYWQALIIKPDDILTSAKLGEALNIAGCIEEANELFHDIFHIPKDSVHQKNSPEKILAHGIGYYTLRNTLRNPLGNLKAASSYIKAVVKQETIHQAEALVYLGLSYHAKGKYEKSIEIYDAIIQSRYLAKNELLNEKISKTAAAMFYPQIAVIHKISSLKALKRYDEALALLENLFLTVPKPAVIFSLKASLLDSKGCYEEAMQYYFLADYFRQFPLLSASAFSTLISGDVVAIDWLREGDHILTDDQIRMRLADFEHSYSTKLKNNYLAKLTKQFGKIINEDLLLSTQISSSSVSSEIYYYQAKKNTSGSTEFKINLLKKVERASTKYGLAQYELYQLISSKNILDYTDLAAREKDLHQSLECLLIAAASGSQPAKEIAKEMNLEQIEVNAHLNFDGNKITDLKQIEEVAEKIWVAELKTIPLTSPLFGQAQYLVHNYYLKLALSLDKETTFDDFVHTKIACIKATFEHLLNAKLAGYPYAVLHEPNEKIRQLKPLQGFEIELQQVIDTEIKSHLAKITPESPYYVEAQRILFEIYHYSHRYYIDYQSYEQRVEDIAQGLRHLVEAYLHVGDEREFIEDSLLLKQLADRRELIPILSWMILDHEIGINQETLPQPLIYSDHCFRQYHAEYKCFSLYRRLPLHETQAVYRKVYDGNRAGMPIDEFVSIKMNELKKREAEYSAIFMSSPHVKKITCSSPSSANGFYLIELSQDQLTSTAFNTIYFVDHHNREIASLQLSENHICLNGYGNNIRLRLKDDAEIKQSIFRVKNAAGKLELIGDFYSQQVLYIYAQGKQLFYQGNMTSQGSVIIETDGHLHLSKDSEIKSLNKVCIQSATLNCESRSVTAASSIQLVAKVIELSQCSALAALQGDVSMIANSLKKMEGRVLCENLILDIKYNIYFRGDNADLLTAKNSVHASRSIIISATSIMSSRGFKIFADHDLIVKFKNRLLIDEGCVWYADKKLILQGKQADNYAGLRGKEEMIIHTDDVFVNHKTGLIVTKKSYFSGGSVWNAGEIDSGEQCTVSLNKLFVHGIAYSHDMFELRMPDSMDSLKAELLNRPFIHADNLNLVAGGYINLLSHVQVTRFNLCAIAKLNLGLTESIRSTKSSLISIDFGVDVPNVSEVLKYISKTMERLENRDFKAIAEDVFTFENFVTVSSAARFIVRLAAPAISKPLDIAWSIGMLAINSYAMFTYCNDLAKKDHIELRDLIPLLGFANSLANQALQTDMQVESLKTFDPAASHYQPGMNAAASAAIDFLTLLGSSSSNTSILNVSGGVHVNGTETNQAILNYSSGFHIAANYTDMSLRTRQDQFVIANKVCFQEQVSNQNMVMIANYQSMDIQHLTQKGLLITDYAHIEGQQLNIESQISAQTECDITADSLTIQGDITADHANINAHELTLAGDVTTQAECDVTADSLTIQGDIAADLANIKARELTMAGEVIANTEIALKAEKINMDDASLHSKGTTTIEANKGDLTAHIETTRLAIHALEVDANKLLKGEYQEIHIKDSLVIATEKDVVIPAVAAQLNLAVAAPHITIQQDLHTNKDLAFETTEGSLTVNANVTAHDLTLVSDQGKVATLKNITTAETLLVVADQGYSNTAQISANELNVITKHHDIKNTGSIHTNATMQYQALEGDILNTGSMQSDYNLFLRDSLGDIYNKGKIAAANYLQIAAYAGSVSNLCKTITVPGVYGPMKIWTSAEMLGGIDGLDIYAKHNVINDASIMWALDDVNVSGDQGVKSFAEYHSYISYHKHTRTWYGKEDEKTEISVQSKNPVIASQNGSTRVESLNGQIYSLSTEFKAKIGNILHAKSGVELQGIVAETRQYHLHDDCWGLSHETSDRRDDISIPTYVIAHQGNTIIVADEGDVRIINAAIVSPGEVELMGKNVTITSPLLNHANSTVSRKFNFNYPFASQIKSFTSGHFSQLSPLYEDVTTFSYTKDQLAVGLNAWNTALDSVNEANRIISGLRSGNLGAILGLDPTNVTVTYTQNKTTTHYQTMAPNVIQVGSLNIDAEKNVAFENGIPIVVNKDATIHTDYLRQSGAELQASVETQSESVSLDMALSRTPNLGVNYSEGSTHATKYQYQLLQVGGTLTVHANTWEQHNADALTGRLASDVSHFSTVAEKDTTEMMLWNVQVSTTGTLSFGKSTEKMTEFNSSAHPTDLSTRETPRHTERSIYRSTLPFFYQNNLKQLQDNINWVNEGIRPLFAKENTSVLEEKSDFITDETETDHLASTLNAKAHHHHQPVKEKSLNTHHTTSKSPSKRGPSSVVRFFGQDENENQVNDTLHESLFYHPKLGSHIWASVDESGIGKHINGMVETATDVYHFCEVYNSDLEQGKSNTDALSDASTDSIKSILEAKAIHSLLTRCRVGALFYPLAALQTSLTIIADNKETMNKQFDIAHAALPNNINTGDYTLLEKAAFKIVDSKMEQDRQSYNALADLGARLK
jgi:hypothetical protein